VPEVGEAHEARERDKDAVPGVLVCPRANVQVRGLSDLRPEQLFSPSLRGEVMQSQEFLKSFGFPGDGSASTLTRLSLQAWRRLFEARTLKDTTSIPMSPYTGGARSIEGCPMLFLRLDQALELLRAARTLRERLVIRYFVFNGLSPMELSNGRIEHLDPLSCTLFLPRRHWKRNCLTDIDPETVRLQVMYSGDRAEGPLIRGRPGRSLAPMTLWEVVKTVALRTSIPGKESICPLVLKRTFAREWMLAGGSVCTLQKAFSHKHLWSTAHYLRFLTEDIKPDHSRLLARARGEVVS
jgi:integrase